MPIPPLITLSNAQMPGETDNLTDLEQLNEEILLLELNMRFNKVMRSATPGLHPYNPSLPRLLVTSIRCSPRAGGVSGAGLPE